MRGGITSKSSTNSRLYDCSVLHVRSVPKKHQFRYKYFTFCLDLDEVEQLSQKSFLFGTELRKVFRFRSQDFIFASSESEKTPPSLSPVDLKIRICRYLKDQGVKTSIHRVELVAHMRTLGYSYNPAAFYFCYSNDDRPIAAILEVTNTYREKKAYLLGPESFDFGNFKSSKSKYFYVSPFVDLDSHFDMRLTPPSQTLRFQIDSKLNGKTLVHSLVTGEMVPLSERALLKRLLLHPLISLEVMAKIHYQALRLLLKKVPYFKKSAQTELQIGGLR